MSPPVLFVIDDDPGVVAALHDDLSRRFGEDFRVIAASSAAAGLATLRDLADQHEAVALLIAGHRMGEMPGVDFLRSAHVMHPQARRVLLVERDYSARSPVVRAMTLGQADYHLSKPWMLEQDLYREISEFLADWAKDQEAGFELFRIVGRLQDHSTHEITGGHGSGQLDGLTVHDRLSGGTAQVAAAALFVLIGGEPHTQWLPGEIQLERGYIRTGRDVAPGPGWPPGRPPFPLETSMPGVFAAGDARYRSIKRVASAVGDGATAVRLTQEYLAWPHAARLRRPRVPAPQLLRVALADSRPVSPPRRGGAKRDNRSSGVAGRSAPAASVGSTPPGRCATAAVSSRRGIPRPGRSLTRQHRPIPPALAGECPRGFSLHAFKGGGSS